MTFDIPHMVISAVIVFIVIWAVNNLSALENMTKRRRSLIMAATTFVAILLLNIVWPYGTTA